MATKKTKSSKTKTVKTTAKKPAAKKSVTTKSAPKPKTVHATEPYHPAFGIIILIVCALVLAVLLPFAIKALISRPETDAERFSEEYSLVEKNNVFVFKTAEETKKILEHGTGVIFLGFPSCPWCQTYAKMLDELAKEKGIDTVYYYNIREDREKSTQTYQDFVSILSDYLQFDDLGNKRIYVPNVTFVVDGKIIGNDLETSKDTLGNKTPEKYWTEERLAAWKERVGKMMEKVADSTGCETTCNE